MSACLFGSPLHGELYGDPEIAGHFTAEAEIAAILRFEGALALAEARLGIIPEKAGPAIDGALLDVAIAPESLAAATARAGVPVPALVSALRERIGPPFGDFVHWGATSQDAVDTGLVLRLRPVLDILDGRLCKLTDILLDAAERWVALPMAARTRSQIAVPTTLGLRIAGWASPLMRCLDRLAEMRPRLLVVQLGGAAGTLSAFGESGLELMEALAAELELGAPAKPWHVERDGPVELGNWLAMVSGLLGRIGADLILMGRSEIGELTAGVGGGSSTMPQKSNPVGAETLVALGRFTAAQAALLQQALVHVEERDGVAWSTEWMALPAMLTATGAGLLRAAELAGTLCPNPERLSAGRDHGGGIADAEAFAFALARQMPLPRAQALVKEASAALADEGGTLSDHVARACRGLGLEAPARDDSATFEIARRLVERVRKSWARTRSVHDDKP